MDQRTNDAALEALRALDTPTVCNALELISPAHRLSGYNTRPLHCTRPHLPPMVGYARTVTIRSEINHQRPPEEFRRVLHEYYSYIEAGPRPSVVVVQDLDETVGQGSFWGEVFTNVHKGLGAIGAVTNGSVRDLDDNAEGFQILAGMVLPSHAWVHVTGWGSDVKIHGMAVSHGDIIHADKHGAVVVPHDIADQVAEAAALISRRERVLITAAQTAGFTADKFREAMETAAKTT